MKKRKKVLIIIISSVLGTALLVSAFLYFSGLNSLLMLAQPSKSEIDSIDEYHQIYDPEEYMPDPREDIFNGYASIDFRYKKNIIFIFSEQWIRMIMSYDEQSYEEQTERIYENLEFVSGTVSYHEYSPNFHYKDFDFKTCVSYDWGWPKKMFFVGFNEQKHKICYISFFDQDLDDEEDFPKFFKQEKFF